MVTHSRDDYKPRIERPGIAPATGAAANQPKTSGIWSRTGHPRGVNGEPGATGGLGRGKNYRAKAPDSRFEHTPTRGVRDAWGARSPERAGITDKTEDHL